MKHLTKLVYTLALLQGDPALWDSKGAFTREKNWGQRYPCVRNITMAADRFSHVLSFVPV